MSPASVAIDSSGNLYIADSRNSRIRRVDANTGLVSTFAGNGSGGFAGDGGPASIAELYFPSGVAFDVAGNLLVSDSGNHRIRRVDARTGIITTVAGNGEEGHSGDGGPATEARLAGPRGLAFDRFGNLFIADDYNNRVRRVDARTGSISTVAGNGTQTFSGDGGSATAAGIFKPQAVAVDSSGNVFIADTWNNRVRRVEAGTGAISTVAGNGVTTSGGLGSYSGDGGPATAAGLNRPWGLALDSSGNLLVADYYNHRVRRTDASSGIISTLAGKGSPSFSGDGGLAIAAGLTRPVALAVDASNVLYIAELTRIRRVDAATGTISTVAGNDSPGWSGDGGPATTAGLNVPTGVVLDSSGNLFVADSYNSRIRKVDGTTGSISTIAGTGVRGYSGDGGPAVSAALTTPWGIAGDSAGHLYFSDPDGGATVRKIDAKTGAISRVAGRIGYGFAGDGGPATEALLYGPRGVALEESGNLFVADAFNNRVRKVDGKTGVISTFAGNGTRGYSGDGGPATSAALFAPEGIAVDLSGNLLIADTLNDRVRRVDSRTGIITTVAGKGVRSYSGDGGPATLAGLSSPGGVALDSLGNVYIADTDSAVADGRDHRVRRVDAATGIITTVAGTGTRSYFGDGALATAAGLSYPQGLALGPSGSLFIADSGSNRVRAVFACSNVTAPQLISPASGSSLLTWSAVPGAFRYDVYLDTVNPPARLLVADLAYTTPTPFTIPQGATSSYSASNLLPGKTYYWKVVAKGDPFCPSVSTASSAVASFTTTGTCSSPGLVALSSPTDGAAGVASAAVLSWQASPGAGAYDVYFGPSSPPALAASGVTGTSYSAPALTAGATYYWSVTARASCDPTKTTSSGIRSFRVTGSCSSPGDFSATSPSDGAAGLSPSPTLSWSASANASSYDLYLGTSSNPPLHLSDVAGTSTRVSGLSAGATYYWRVLAKTSCDTTKSSSTSVRKFIVAGSCVAPGSPEISFLPPGNVAAGQTYVVAWMEAPGLDPGGGYVVERSKSSSFATVLDSQATTATSASFTSGGEGTYSHRVRALPACDPARAGQWSAVRDVNVVSGTPDVVFTVQPSAVVTALGERIDDNKKAVFTLENIGRTELTLQLGQQFLGPVAFFSVVDPLGGSVNGFRLPPRQPKSFEIRFQGVDPGVSGAYQGVVYALQANFQPLAITPFAFVNLKVGGGDTTAPAFKAAGVPTEYAFFPGAEGDPSARTLSVDVANTGSSPMDLAAEVGPELWLVPEPGWNSTPIPPGASRTVKLRTDRTRAPEGSALPRYTYFTVRTKAGQTTRLLVQDNDAPAAGPARAGLSPGARSFIVPSAVNATSKIQNTFVSRLRLSNAGSEDVQATLYFSPHDADGFGTSVRSATVVVPRNDVVTLTDPLVQLFGLTPPASGQVEVRAAAEKIGALTVTSSVDAPAKTGGTFGFQMPSVRRGDGARMGRPHVVSGVTFTPKHRTNLILAETTGVDRASVRATLYDKDGNRKGDRLLDVPRYGQTQVAVDALGAPSGLEAGRIELSVEGGGGAAVGLVTVIDNTNDDSVTYFGRSADVPASPSLLDGLARKPIWAKAAGTVKVVVPSLVNGYATFLNSTLPYTFQSLVGFSSLSSAPATFRLSYTDLNSGQKLDRTVTVPGRATREYPNVLEELFGLPKGQKSQGPLFVEADLNGLLYCKVFSVLQTGTLGDSFPVIPVSSEDLTGTSSAKPLYVDGLEQSVDLTRGTRSNLILNEVTGLGPATVVVRLYEPGNRSTPIAEEEVTVAAGGKEQLSTVFARLGLESAQRRKDRTNVLCVVTAKSGSGLVSAVVTTIDNRTGDTKNSLLTPSGGVSSSPGVSVGF